MQSYGMMYKQEAIVYFVLFGAFKLFTYWSTESTFYDIYTNWIQTIYVMYIQNITEVIHTAENANFTFQMGHKSQSPVSRSTACSTSTPPQQPSLTTDVYRSQNYIILYFQKNTIFFIYLDR